MGWGSVGDGSFSQGSMGVSFGGWVGWFTLGVVFIALDCFTAEIAVWGG